MNEGERLQWIVKAQEKELRRLRKLLSTARVAQAEISIEDGKVHVTVTAIGVDEYHFIEQAKPELERLISAILEGQPKVIATEPITDSITGEPMEGAVSLESTC